MKKIILIIIIITIICLSFIELTSFLIIKFGKLELEYPIFNRELALYSTFNNVANFKHATIKAKKTEKDVIIDECGFIFKNKNKIKKYINQTAYNNIIEILLNSNQFIT